MCCGCAAGVCRCADGKGRGEAAARNSCCYVRTARTVANADGVRDPVPIPAATDAAIEHGGPGHTLWARHGYQHFRRLRCDPTWISTARAHLWPLLWPSTAACCASNAVLCSRPTVDVAVVCRHRAGAGRTKGRSARRHGGQAWFEGCSAVDMSPRPTLNLTAEHERLSEVRRCNALHCHRQRVPTAPALSGRMHTRTLHPQPTWMCQPEPHPNSAVVTVSACSLEY